MKGERLSISERPVKERKLRHESSERRKVIAPGGQEKILHIPSDLFRFTAQLGMLRTIQKCLEAFAVTDEHQVIPSPPTHHRLPCQGLFPLVSIVKK